jgi:hypothetical protein
LRNPGGNITGLSTLNRDLSVKVRSNGPAPRIEQAAAWNPGSLRLAKQWMVGGPVLPIEFSRVSDNGRLTLVIDETNGVSVATRYAPSSCCDVSTAVADLMAREGTPNRDRIGFLDLPRKKCSRRALQLHPGACEAIRKWVSTQDFDAIVWTAIGPRFIEKTGEPFSVEAAIRYLGSLKGEMRDMALKYIREAPPEAQTPVRRRAQLAFPDAAVPPRPA